MRPSAFALGLCLIASAAAAQDTTYRRIKVIGPEASLQIGYAERALGLGDLEAAMLHAKTALRLEPKAVESHVTMGIVASRRGEHALAGKSFGKALALNPDFYPAWHYKALWLCSQSRFDEAFTDFRRGFDALQQAAPLSGHLEAVRCALQGGRRVVAKEFLDRGLKRMPDSPDLLLLASRMAFDEADHLRARAFLQRAEALRNLDEAALQLAIDIERAAGDERARKRYETRLQEAREAPRP